MKIAIIDCDYESGISRFPNPFLMKISSFWKQKGKQVILETYNIAINDYDKIYVGRLLEASDNPPLKILLDLRTTYYKYNIDSLNEVEKEFPRHFALARPDYLLYKYKFRTEYTDSNFLTFTSQQKIIKTQSSKQHYLVNPLNTIVDYDLWELPKETLLEVLNKIKFLKKVHFLFPIDFSRLFDTDILNKFIEIPLTPSIEQKFENFSANSEEIIKVLKAFKGSNKKLSYVRPGINIQTQEYTTTKDYWSDVCRAVSIGSAAKQAGVSLVLQTNYKDDIFEMLHKWSKSRESLLNYATNWTRAKYGVIAAEAISTPSIWNRHCALVAKIIIRCPHLFDQIITGWNGVQNNIEQINMEKIKEGVNDLPIL